MNVYDFLRNTLTELKTDKLYRDLKIFSSTGGGAYVDCKGKKVLQMSSNDYLGLTKDERIKKAVTEAVEKYGVGSGGSRLISGTHKLHTELEEKLAELKGTEKAIVFSTGYAANIGAISALLTKDDAVYSDELNHASIIDGIKLSGANKFIYKHCDTEKLEKLLEENHKKYRFNIIITDSVFSMDGDTAPLQEIVRIKEKYGAVLYLDEAHAFGVYGERGQGLAHELGLNNKVDIQFGTLSKAAGSEGGYICGKAELIDYLRNKARSFIYSTAPSIPSVAASIKAVEIIRDDTALRNKLQENIRYFKTGLSDVIARRLEKPTKQSDSIATSVGLPHSLRSLVMTMQPSESAIFCIRFKDTQTALQVSEELLEKYNIIATCIRPPTVKTPRIRLCVTALHTKKDSDYVLKCLEAVAY